MDCVELTFRVTKPRASLPALKVQIVGFPGQRRGSTREAAQCTSFVGESEGRGSIRTRNSTVLAGGLLFTAARRRRRVGMGSPPLPFLHLPPLQIDGFADGVGRRSLFPESKSKSFVIHCVAGTSRREDGWTDGWMELVTKNAHGGCFAAPRANPPSQEGVGLRSRLCIFILWPKFGFRV